MHKPEFDAYLDLQDGFRNLSLSVTPTVQTPTLFQLLDENRDGLDVLVHALSGDEIADHTTHAYWLGNEHALDLSALKP